MESWVESLFVCLLRFSLSLVFLRFLKTFWIFLSFLNLFNIFELLSNFFNFSLTFLNFLSFWTFLILELCKFLNFFGFMNLLKQKLFCSPMFLYIFFFQSCDKTLNFTLPIYWLWSHTRPLTSLIFQLTLRLGNPIPTTKFAIQLTKTAIAIAVGRGPCEKSSAVIIHGMEPGPTAKKTTKASVDTTDK